LTIWKQQLQRVVRHIPNVAWASSAQALALIGSLLTLKLLAQLMPVDQLGVYVLALSLSLALVTVIYDPIAKSGLRFARQAAPQTGNKAGPEPKSQSLPKRHLSEGFLSAFLKLHVQALTILTVISILAVCAASMWLSQDWLLLALPIVAMALFQGLVMNASMVGIAFRWHKATALAQGGLAILRPALAGIVLVLLGQGAMYAVSSQALAYAVIGGLFAAVLFINLKTENADASARNTIQAPLYGQMQSYALGLVFTAIVASAALYSDRWLAAHFLNTESVGIYGAIAMLATGPLTAFSAVVYRYAAPIVFDAQASEATGMTSAVRLRIRLALAVWLVGLVIVFVIAAVFHEWIVRITTSQEIATQSVLLPYLVVAYGLDRTGHILSLTGQSLYETRPYVVARLLQVFALLALAWSLVPEGQLVGLATAVAIAAAIYVAAVGLCNAWIVRQKSPASPGKWSP
jgi:O-antigen/teichoic acid export membrane protein